jgi:hypothetical protein
MTFLDNVPSRFGYYIGYVIEIGIQCTIDGLGYIYKRFLVTREPAAYIERVELEPVLFGFVKRETGILDGFMVRFGIAAVTSDMEINPGQFMFGLFGEFINIVEFGETAPELGT